MSCLLGLKLPYLSKELMAKENRRGQFCLSFKYSYDRFNNHDSQFFEMIARGIRIELTFFYMLSLSFGSSIICFYQSSQYDSRRSCLPSLQVLPCLSNYPCGSCIRLMISVTSSNFFPHLCYALGSLNTRMDDKSNNYVADLTFLGKMWALVVSLDAPLA